VAGDRWARVEALFHEARELPAAEVEAFLERQCGDAETLAEVRSLLGHRAPGFLRSGGGLPEPPPPSVEERDRSPSDAPRVDGYEVLATLGEGGMGAVYLAEQLAPARRRVALKVIRTGIESREVIARFEVERQALALMSHRHIAQIYDAGTTRDGRPYFAMEHVPGVPITALCDEPLPAASSIRGCHGRCS